MTNWLATNPWHVSKHINIFVFYAKMGDINVPSSEKYISEKVQKTCWFTSQKSSWRFTNYVICKYSYLNKTLTIHDKICDVTNMWCHRACHVHHVTCMVIRRQAITWTIADLLWTGLQEQTSLTFESYMIQMSMMFVLGVEAWLKWQAFISFQWHHNGRDDVSNRQPHDCLLNSLFGRRSKKTSKFRVTGLCEGNSPGTGEFPPQMASNAENVSIWWRHHVMI